MPEDHSMSSLHAIKELSALALAADIHGCIPNWVLASERGAWYAEKYGLTGPTAYIRQQWLDEREISLTGFVQQLMEWRDTFISAPAAPRPR